MDFDPREVFMGGREKWLSWGNPSWWKLQCMIMKSRTRIASAIPLCLTASNITQYFAISKTFMYNTVRNLYKSS